MGQKPTFGVMQVPQYIIDQLNEKADLVRIIKRHTDLKPNSGEFLGRCPFHGEKTPSFRVNPEKNLYHCFGCGVGGNAITFLMEYERQTFPEALQTLSDQTGIDLPKEDPKKYRYQRTASKPSQPKKPTTPPNTQPNSPPPNSNNRQNTDNSRHNNRQNQQYGDNYINNADNYSDSYDNNYHDNHHNVAYDNPPPYTNNDNDYQTVDNNAQAYEPEQELTGDLHQLLSAVKDFYCHSLTKNPIAYRYLTNRGISDAMIQQFELGYAPNEWQILEKIFPNDKEGLKLLGLIRTTQKGNEIDLFKDRVIFPIKNRQGKVVGFAGRTMSDEVLPKYINSTDSVVFHKQDILYGYYEARQARNKDWLVVEGYLDVISLYQAGIFGAVAPMGTAMNERQIDGLLKFTDELTLCFDGDNAGQKAAMRTLEVAMPVLTDGKSLKFLTLPDNHDPDTYIKAHGKDAMAQQIANALPMADYLYGVMANRYELNRPEQKAAAMRDLRALTDKLPKGSSFRSWLNGDFFNRLRGNRHAKPTVYANYHTDQLSLAEQLALCLLYCPTLAHNIDTATPNSEQTQHDWQASSDPLARFFAECELTTLDEKTQKRLTERNELTPRLPHWSDFFKENQSLSTLIALAKTANPHLCQDDTPNARHANAVFLLSAMGDDGKRLASHWAEFFAIMNSQNSDNPTLRLMHELFCQASLIALQNALTAPQSLLSTQIQKNRQDKLSDWLRRHSTL